MQHTELRFVFERPGTLRGACLHIELLVADGEAEEAEISSASEVSVQSVISHRSSVISQEEAEISSASEVSVQSVIGHR